MPNFHVKVTDLRDGQEKYRTAYQNCNGKYFYMLGGKRHMLSESELLKGKNPTRKNCRRSSRVRKCKNRSGKPGRPKGSRRSKRSKRRSRRRSRCGSKKKSKRSRRKSRKSKRRSKKKSKRRSRKKCGRPRKPGRPKKSSRRRSKSRRKKCGRPKGSKNKRRSRKSKKKSKKRKSKKRKSKSVATSPMRSMSMKVGSSPPKLNTFAGMGGKRLGSPRRLESFRSSPKRNSPKEIEMREFLPGFGRNRSSSSNKPVVVDDIMFSS